MTPRQLALLDFVSDFISVHRHAPSYEQMREGIGAASKGHIAGLIDRLVERGHLRRGPGRHRSIEIVHDRNVILRQASTADLRRELARRGEDA
jgi:repressor LexA